MSFASALAEAAVLASSLSIDAFTAGFAYGSKRIEIPLSSAQLINIICAAITGISLLAGALLKPYLPERAAVYAAFAILFTIGITKMLDGITKTIIRRYGGLSKEFEMYAFNFKFILSLYADPEKADIDASKAISPAEASALAIALSLDGAAVGFGAALGNADGLMVFMCSLITNTAALATGCALGHRLSKKAANLSWLSGAALIVLAFLKLI